MMPNDKESFVEYVCRDFLESWDMADYVLSLNAEAETEPGPCRMRELICSSRAALDKKALALEKLAALWPQVDSDHRCGPEPAKLAQEARRALAETERAAPGTVFIAKEYSRGFISDDALNNNYIVMKSAAPFNTFSEVLQFISKKAQEQRKDEAPTDEFNTWYTVDRWDRNDEGKLAYTISWDLSNTGRIWGFGREKDDEGKMAHAVNWNMVYTDRIGGDGGKFDWWNIDEYSILPGYGPGLFLRTPFASGDIIIVDVRPYREIALGIILEAAGQNEDCSPQCMVIWQQCVLEYTEPACVVSSRALKVCSCALGLWPRRYPSFSALLRARYAKQSDIAAFAEHDPSRYDSILALSERIKRDPAFMKRCSDYLLYDYSNFHRRFCDFKNMIRALSNA